MTSSVDSFVLLSSSLIFLPNKIKSLFASSPPPKSSFVLAAILNANSAPKPDADPKTATNDLINVNKRYYSY
ncbi:hypothetical protein AYI69_g5059 [Smittium culicis]|uniref:Uncharacterized protein n=1 Tax=Smittium culicis TaxID=133412 RepID=A0A1R1Y8S2_9FUNG|nr:hypothetical protein AYI69_g5059 [Smittium culicis]